MHAWRPIRRSFASAVVIACVVAAGPGCKKAGEGLLVVSVDSPTMMIPNVIKLDVTILTGPTALARTPKLTYQPDAGVPTLSSTAITLGVKLPGDIGSVKVHVDAFGGTGVVASGTSAPVLIKDGAEKTITVDLAPGPPPDAGTSSDGSAGTIGGAAGHDGGAGSGGAGGRDGAAGTGGGSGGGTGECQIGDRTCNGAQPRSCSQTTLRFVDDGAPCAEPTPLCSFGTCICMSHTTCSNVCTDLANDSHNCGQCGYDCKVTTCKSNFCLVIVLASNQRNPRSLVSDATNLYWLDDTGGGQLSRMVKSTMVTTTLATGRSPVVMAVDAGDMYVAEQNDAAAGRIRKYPAAGGNPVIIADNLVSPRSIAVRGGIVYWSDVGDASISRAPTSGAGPTTQMAISQPSTYKVAVDDTSIYWLSAGDGAVRKLDLGAVVPSTPTMLSTTSQNVTDMVIDGTSAYWLDENGNNAFSTIYKVSLQGGQKMMIASQEFTYSGKLALDGSYLYWDAVPFSRVPIAGGKVEHIPQAAPPYASSIAIDATKAYWTGMDGTVNALGKL